jgi:ribosomal protein L36
MQYLSQLWEGARPALPFVPSPLGRCEHGLERRNGRLRVISLAPKHEAQRGASVPRGSRRESRAQHQTHERADDRERTSPGSDGQVSLRHAYVRREDLPHDPHRFFGHLTLPIAHL